MDWHGACGPEVGRAVVWAYWLSTALHNHGWLHRVVSSSLARLLTQFLFSNDEHGANGEHGGSLTR